jgi:nitrate reductase gamma subunit
MRAISVAGFKQDLFMIGIYMLLIGFALGFVTAQAQLMDECTATLDAQAQHRQ